METGLTTPEAQNIANAREPFSVLSPLLVRPLFVRSLFIVLGIALLAGCTVPTPGYRKVDQNSPEFQALTERTSAALQANGVGTEDADRRAIQAATRQMVAAQKEDRPRQVKPLAAALDAFDQPRGCWAYTVSTRRVTDGKLSVQVETFDASQPESRIWTLVSRNGQTPDEAEQAKYREDKLRSWKKSLARAKSRHMDSGHMTRDAVYADLQIAAEKPGQTRFVFSRGRMSIPVVGTITSSRTGYLLDDATGKLLGVTRMIGPNSMILGIRVHQFETSSEFTNIDDSLPPFITKLNAHVHIVGFGKDTGDLVHESVYSDYRRVKCYEQRFNVKVGTPEVQDFLPE